MATTDPRIDAYIQKASPVAQPLLIAIRAAVHAASPDIEETVKWRIPSFDHKGIMCGMASFKNYTTFSFWKSKSLAERLSAADAKALKQIDRIQPGDALPARATLIRIIKAAVQLNDEGVVEKRAAPRKKAPVKTPPPLLTALKANPKALAAYQAFPPSHKREYVEWITEAKQAETRQRRIASAVEWIGAGKSRNWKYERP